MTIGERLVEERKKLHLTQEELGLKLNISKQAISKWESGLCLPDTANLIKLSSLFENSGKMTPWIPVNSSRGKSG